MKKGGSEGGKEGERKLGSKGERNRVREGASV